VFFVPLLVAHSEKGTIASSNQAGNARIAAFSCAEQPEATTMQLSNGERADDPLARFQAVWRSRARSVKDTWLPGTHPIEAAMEGTFREGVAFAAELLEKEGQIELAIKLRARVQRSV
jgi:hypothetical protein